MNPQQIPKYPYHQYLQLANIRRKVQVLVPIKIVLVLYPVLELMKLRQLRILSRDNQRHLLGKVLRLNVLPVAKKVKRQYLVNQV